MVSLSSWQQVAVASAVLDKVPIAKGAGYREEGDEELHSTENLARRLQIKQHDRVQNWLRKFFLTFESPRVAKNDGAIAKEEVCGVEVLMCQSLFDEFDVGEAVDAVEADWLREVGVKTTMTEEEFVDSLFELVDIWTEDISVMSYTTLLRRLFKSITLVDHGSQTGRRYKSYRSLISNESGGTGTDNAPLSTMAASLSSSSSLLVTTAASKLRRAALLRRQTKSAETHQSEFRQVSALMALNRINEEKKKRTTKIHDSRAEWQNWRSSRLVPKRRFKEKAKLLIALKMRTGITAEGVRMREVEATEEEAPEIEEAETAAEQQQRSSDEPGTGLTVDITLPTVFTEEKTVASHGEHEQLGCFFVQGRSHGIPPLEIVVKAAAMMEEDRLTRRSRKRVSNKPNTPTGYVLRVRKKRQAKQIGDERVLFCMAPRTRSNKSPRFLRRRLQSQAGGFIATSSPPSFVEEEPNSSTAGLERIDAVGDGTLGQTSSEKKRKEMLLRRARRDVESVFANKQQVPRRSNQKQNAQKHDVGAGGLTFLEVGSGATSSESRRGRKNIVAASRSSTNDRNHESNGRGRPVCSTDWLQGNKIPTIYFDRRRTDFTKAAVRAILTPTASSPSVVHRQRAKSIPREHPPLPPPTTSARQTTTMQLTVVSTVPATQRETAGPGSVSRRARFEAAFRTRDAVSENGQGVRKAPKTASDHRAQLRRVLLGGTAETCAIIKYRGRWILFGQRYRHCRHSASPPIPREDFAEQMRERDGNLKQGEEHGPFNAVSSTITEDDHRRCNDDDDDGCGENSRAYSYSLLLPERLFEDRPLSAGCTRCDFTFD